MQESSGSNGDPLASEARELLEHTKRVESMASLLAKLAERTQRLDALLDELRRANKLDTVLAELERTQQLDALDIFATALVAQIDQLAEVVVAVDDTDDFNACMTDLSERANQLDELVAQLQSYVAPP